MCRHSPRGQRKPWTTSELAAGSGASGRLARRYVARLAAAGYLARTGVDDSAGRPPFWQLRRWTGPICPALVDGAHGTEVRDRNGGVTGAELARLRQRRCLSLREMADLFGAHDTRTIQRWENATALPGEVARRYTEIRDFAGAKG